MSTTVGIFDDQDAAEAVIDRLDALGLDEGSIHVLSRRGVRGRGDTLVGVFARAFQGGDGAISGELTRLGLDREEALFYEQELDEESLLVVVDSGDERASEVHDVMRAGDATLHER